MVSTPFPSPSSGQALARKGVRGMVEAGIIKQAIPEKEVMALDFSLTPEQEALRKEFD